MQTLEHGPLGPEVQALSNRFDSPPQELFFPILSPTSALDGNITALLNAGGCVERFLPEIHLDTEVWRKPEHFIHKKIGLQSSSGKTPVRSVVGWEQRVKLWVTNVNGIG